MRCSKARKWISTRLDGELDASRQVSLATHLERCSECRAYARRSTMLDLDLLKVPEATADFTTRVMARLAEVSSQRRPLLSRPEWFRPVAAGLGIAASIAGFAVGSLLTEANASRAEPRNAAVEVAASDAVDPLATDSVESVLIAMLSNAKE